MKNQYIGGKLHKKGGFGQFADLCEGGGAWTVCRFKVGLAKKRAVLSI